MRIYSVSLSLMVLLCSCASLKNVSSFERHAPSLGTIGNQSQSLLHTSFQRIGHPSLERPIAVLVKEVPFTKSSFKKYTAYKKNSGMVPEIQLIDSLGTKSSYLCLEITDKIALRDALNSEKNNSVLSYLEKDDAYCLVYKIALYPNLEAYRLLMQSDRLFLETDRNGILILKARNRNLDKEIILSQMEIFDYSSLGFCWGETQYGRKQIEALVGDGDSCPKNTERKAYKLDESKSYLKL
ncbi:hypothetical protein [Ulvibacterium sp.]|uniref:hypothetical protein n=1 Tax=Ulvibacterium sp. TaxID=2665914 RepID=UPI00261C0BCC|nr:hypothetical protein [Ulvibacterium sp.]